MAADRDIVIEAPADIVQHKDDIDSNPNEADDVPKRDLNIEQPELKELIEEKIAKEENAEEEKPQDDTEKVVDGDVDTHEGEDDEEKEVVKDKKAEEEKEKEAEKDEAAKEEKKDLDAKIEAAAAQKNDDQPALAPPMVRTSLIKQDKIKIVV